MFLSFCIHTSNAFSDTLLEQDHGPEYIEENGEYYTQEQDGENNLQTEELTENESRETQLDVTNQTELDASHEAAIPDDESVQPELYDAASEPQDGVEVTGSYDDAQEQEAEENSESAVDDDAVPASVEVHDVPAHDGEGEGREEGSVVPVARQFYSYRDFPEQEVTETSNEAPPPGVERGSHESGKFYHYLLCFHPEYSCRV